MAPLNNSAVKKNKRHIKSGDTVYVIAGKEKGKTGKVLRIEKNDQVIVEKLNIVKRHSKPTQQNPTGGIVEKESGIHISNLMIYDAASSAPTRVGYKVDDKGKKTRISKKSGEVI